MIRKLLLATMIATSVVGIATPAAAAVEVFVQVAPPPLRQEAVPAPRHGYFWVPGNWNSRSGHYVWASGTWVHERPGYQYHAPTWVEDNGRWSKHQGSWDRGDHDGAGVEGHPGNPHGG
jgi:hypothetical protein